MEGGVETMSDNQNMGARYDGFVAVSHEVFDDFLTMHELDAWQTDDGIVYQDENMIAQAIKVLKFPISYYVKPISALP